MPHLSLDWLNSITLELSRYDDTGMLLDRILHEARALCQAEAGTVFLVDDDALIFAYTHNDVLFPVETAYKYAYASARLPLDTKSIAGYCAVSRETLNIPDVRNLPDHVPYSFNDSFDRATGFTTVSMLVIPLLGRAGQPLGVIQLINRKTPEGSKPFSNDRNTYLGLLGVQAVAALERSFLAREMIHRMQMMAALNDPKETGSHVERVGAIAAEIYQRWAEKNEVPLDRRRMFRSHLRQAAMVHDLGKVAIPQAILKKPGTLTREEFDIIKEHCIAGAHFFKSANLDVDIMSHDIALHHHQRWDGTGYPEAFRLAGTDIPLAARITAVADVFDALLSKRCYKPKWPWEEATALLKRESGSHFDPDIVEAFLEIEDTVRIIFERFPEEPETA